jgi:phosphoglycerate dehydrogenase-like enzyme
MSLRSTASSTGLGTCGTIGSATVLADMASRAPRIALAPDDAPAWMAEAITAGGGHLVDLAEAEALVWGAPRDAKPLARLLDDPTADRIRWVQLPFAGVESFISMIDDDRTWTCGKGVYAEPVAELALGLAIAGMRGVGTYARASKWSAPIGTNLRGARVTILGGGGITESLLRLLTPFGCSTTVVRRHVRPMAGADVVVEGDRLHEALPGADLVVVALALTPDTDGIIGAGELALLEPHAWIVNVARGQHIVTDDLVHALTSATIGGAALDVTDPEPLPDDHPLWTLPNCIITPHVGNTPDMARPLLAERITTNVKRWAAGEPLIGLVDPLQGY